MERNYSANLTRGKMLYHACVKQQINIVKILLLNGCVWLNQALTFLAGRYTRTEDRLDMDLIRLLVGHGAYIRSPNDEFISFTVIDYLKRYGNNNDHNEMEKICNCRTKNSEL